MFNETEKVYACWLMNCPGLSDRQKYRLFRKCGSLEELYFASEKLWAEVLTEHAWEALKAHTRMWKPKQEYEQMQEKGIHLVIFSEKQFPEKLKDIPDPPFGLFVKGKLAYDSVPTVAIIGARECSEYGRHVATSLAKDLAKAQVPVISGMARGIDGIAQKAVLEAGGYSMGVLGSGVDVCYPAQNRQLYEMLQQNGAVVSAFPIGTPAKPLNFPIRNRIVSGLADIVVVVEAREKSGTLITVDMALEQGREVYVVPGRVTDQLSNGCNALIKQGANVFTSTKEFLSDIYPKRQDSGQGEYQQNLQNGISAEAKEVLEKLDFDPKSVNTIVHELNGKLSFGEVTSNLMMLCSEGRARQVSPGQFCRL